MLSLCQHYNFLCKAKSDIKLVQYRVTDSLDNTTEYYREDDYIRSLDVFADKANKTYPEYIQYHNRDLRKFVRDRYINTVYETIINYLQINEKKHLLKTHFRKQDWFQMLYALRNNASHFDNFGKPVIHDYIDWIPDTITWNDLSIKKSQLGHEVVYTDTYIRELAEHGQNYIISIRHELE